MAYALIAQAEASNPPVVLVILGVLVFIGVLLLILGRTLAKPACSITGLMLGAFVGFTIGQVIDAGGTMTSVIVMGAAAAGSLLATMLFRLWVTLTGMALMALVVPAVALIWQGSPAPAMPALDPDQPATFQEDSIETPAEPVPESEESSEIQAVAGGIVQVLRSIISKQTNAISEWLTSLTRKEKMFLVTGAIVGAVMGLVFGLFRPQLASSIQAAVVGSFFVYVPGRELLDHFLPSIASWLPNTPRWMLIIMGLITVLGILIQWMMAGDEADK